MTKSKNKPIPKSSGSFAYGDVVTFTIPNKHDQDVKVEGRVLVVNLANTFPYQILLNDESAKKAGFRSTYAKTSDLKRI